MAAAGHGCALAIRGLRVTSRSGGRDVPILGGVDLDLEPGEIVGVVGESGSGKSTLCRTIARLLPSGLRVEAGTIRMGSLDLLRARPDQLHRMPTRGVRMVFQDPMTALNPVMTVGDQCVEAARAGRRLSRSAALTRSVALLERMGIKNAASRMRDYPYQFSGGQRQRIVASIALAGDPAVLLADEPTSALDVSTQAALLELIKEVCTERRTAVLFVSHNYAVVSQLCARVLVLYAGQMMEHGPSRTLLTESRHPYTAALIASLPSLQTRLRRLPAIPGQPPRAGEEPHGCPFRPRCRNAEDGCGSAPMVMREIAPGHQTSCVRVESIWAQTSEPGRTGQAVDRTGQAPWPGGGDMIAAAAAGRATFDLVLRRCRVEGRPGLADIAVSAGVIADVADRVGGEGKLELDADGRLVSCAFVQPHIHLDKVGTLPLVGRNRSGTLAEAIDILHRIKRASTPADIARRAGVVIRQAVLSGTTRIRTHVDVDTIGGLAPLRGVLQAAREHADLCDIQTVVFPQEGIIRDPGTAELMDAALREGGEVVGGMPHWERDDRAARDHIGICLDLAQRYDTDVDMHIDETDDAGSMTLGMLVDATLDRGWQGRVTAGHCCAMAAWDDEYASEVISRAVTAGLRFVTNPATNLLLQGRLDGEPRRRGVPRIKELLAAGLQVACGQDCVQDGFYPFGAADQLQVALILCHAAQLSDPAEIEASLTAIRAAAASVMGVRGYGLEPGCAADLVVLDSDDPHEALRLQAARVWVIRRGSIVAETMTSQVIHRSRNR